MKTEIIAVGSELLTPDFQDTNSLFLTERLNSVGLDVAFKTIVGDDEGDLARVIRTALGRSRLILLMGGLGPTEDDRTRETLAKVLGARLIFKAAILRHIRARFRRRGLDMPATNRKQCYAIEGAEVLANPHGTAPGLWLERGKNRLAVLPGPPRELRPMVENHVLPRLAALGRGRMVRRTIRLTGIGESLMESLIKPVYASVPKAVRVTTLAAPGDLAITLTYRGPASLSEAQAVIEGLESALLKALRRWVYSRNGEGLEAVVGALLKKEGRTVACAESCTGGLVGHRLTAVPGSSAYFLESAVVYGNAAKVRRLGVPPALIDKHGAVSAAVARAMAAGVRSTAGADFGLAVTGIAGPDGGTARKPVGLVYTALAHAGGVAVRRDIFYGGRAMVRFQASQKALDVLRRFLLKADMD